MSNRLLGSNEYLDEYRQFAPTNGHGHAWKYHNDPKEYATTTERAVSCWKAREVLIAKYAFAIPNDLAIQTLVKLSPIVEFGAGAGYWAYLITRAGGEIIAYDNYSDDYNGFVTHSRWFATQKGDVCADVAEHADRTLFLCWPPYDTPMATVAAKEYFKAGGKTIVYVGEGHGGCTANDDFYAFLQKRYAYDRTVELPQWRGIHDDLYVYQRK